MKNIFAEHPTTTPAELVAGDFWIWSRPDITSAYPTTAYTLVYRLNLQGKTKGAYQFTATKTTGEHVIEAQAAATEKCPAGAYLWQAVAVRDSDGAGVTVDRGDLTITAGAGAVGSWVYQVLLAIRATILGTASEKQAAYSVGGRSLSLRTPAELVELEQVFLQRWEQERAARDRQAGRSSQKRVLVKMGA